MLNFTPARSIAPFALGIVLLVALHPSCPVYENLHLLCPGCGGTRALAALFHLHPVLALRLNPLTTLLLPCALAYLCRALHQNRWPVLPSASIYSVLTLTCVFTIARNLMRFA